MAKKQFIRHLEFYGFPDQNKYALKNELYDEMKTHGFEHLFTINARTLSATVKEIKANNDDVLPDWLEGLIRIYEEPSIRVAKSR